MKTQFVIIKKIGKEFYASEVMTFEQVTRIANVHLDPINRDDFKLNLKELDNDYQSMKDDEFYYREDLFAVTIKDGLFVVVHDPSKLNDGKRRLTNKELYAGATEFNKASTTVRNAGLVCIFVGWLTGLTLAYFFGIVLLICWGLAKLGTSCDVPANNRKPLPPKTSGETKGMMKGASL